MAFLHHYLVQALSGTSILFDHYHLHRAAHLCMACKFGIGKISICIIVFTIIVKLVMLPINIKQQKTMKLNSVIMPEIQAIQKKYANKKDNDSMMKQQAECCLSEIWNFADRWLSAYADTVSDPACIVCGYGMSAKLH